MSRVVSLKAISTMASRAKYFIGDPAITRRVSGPGWKRWKATCGYIARRVGTALSKRPLMRLLRPCIAE